MFFINRGTVEVVSEDGTVVFASMNEGKFFGEISLVFSCPRTASIRCAPVPMWCGSGWGYKCMPTVLYGG